MTAADLELGRVYPAVRNIREVSVHVAVKLVKYLYEVQLAARQPQPTDIEACLRSQLYSPLYSTAAFVPNS